MRIAITGQINDFPGIIDPEKIDQLSLSRRRRDFRHILSLDEEIDE